MELFDPTTRLRDDAPDTLVSLAPVATLTWYTDPWSVWCFALEPVILRLRLTYGSQIRVQIALGGIIESRPPGTFDVGGVATIFETARRASSMPITTRALFEDPPASTFPAGIACAAVGLVDPRRAEAYMRRLREYAFVIGANISRVRVQRQVAEEVHLDLESFDEALASGEAEREFSQDLASGQGRNIHAYPTIVIERTGSPPIALSGVVQYPVLRETLLRYTEANLREFQTPGIPEAFRVQAHLSTREVAELLDIGIEDAFERLVRLEVDRVVRRIALPGGYLWARG